MQSLTIAVVVFVVTAVAGILGTQVRPRLPPEHLDETSKDVVRAVMGLIATIAALVLGLLIASASSSFTAEQQGLQKLGVQVVTLDRLLRVYGPEAGAARADLRDMIVLARDRMWSSGSASPADIDAAEMRRRADNFVGALHGLTPHSDIQTFTRNQALSLALETGETRLFVAENVTTSIPAPLLALLVGWICLLFVGFGLFARLHATMLVTLLIGAASVASAIFIIMELTHPYTGLIRLSDAPVRTALASIDRGTVQ